MRPELERSTSGNRASLREPSTPEAYPGIVAGVYSRPDWRPGSVGEVAVHPGQIALPLAVVQGQQPVGGGQACRPVSVCFRPQAGRSEVQQGIKAASAIRAQAPIGEALSPDMVSSAWVRLSGKVPLAFRLKV